MKVSVYAAISADGYLARPNGDIGWQHRYDLSSPDGEDYGYGQFITSVDCIIVGRGSFEKALHYPEWPYGDKLMIVLSRILKEVPTPVADRVKIYSGCLDALMQQLVDRGVERVYVGGGKTTQSFLKAGLVTDITLLTIPVLIGRGIRLFGDLESDLPLQHQTTTCFDNGLVQTRYTIPLLTSP